MASQYGITPWGAWFVEALEAYDDTGRLSRGKSYANTGKVAKLEAKACSVTAKVKGRSRPWYRVTVDFSPLKKAEKTRIFEIIGENPMLLARIEAGELPSELLAALKKEKIALIPKRWKEMKRTCSCPDWGDPCKHMAAVYYLLAREIDADPRLLFRLRGVELSSRADGATDSAAKGKRRGAASPASSDAPSSVLATSVAPIFTDEERVPPTEPPQAPRLESYAGLILSLLPKKPSFCSADFSMTMAEFYHAAAREYEGFDGRSASPSVESMFGNATLLQRRFSSSRFSLDATQGKDVVFPFGAATTTVLNVEPEGGDALSLPLSTACTLFLNFKDDSGNSGYRFLFHAFRLLRAVLAAGAFTPFPFVEDKTGELRVLWRPFPAAKDLRSKLDELALYDTGLWKSDKKTASGRSTVDLISIAFLSGWVKGLGFKRASAPVAIRDFADLFFRGSVIDIRRPGLNGLPHALEAWLSVFSLDFRAFRYRFGIDAKGEPLAFRLTIGVLAPPSGDDVPPKPVALKNAAKAFGGMEVLRAPTALSTYLPEIRELAMKPSVTLSEERLGAFLGDAGRLLSRLGVEVVLPKELRRALTPKLVLHAETKGAASLKSYLDLEGLLSYDWRVAVGDTTLSVAEFEKLVKGARSIVAFRDGYVRLDAVELSRMLDRARSPAAPSALDALASRLTGDVLFSADAEELVANLFRERDAATPEGLAAELRPYQERGFRWVHSNLLNGFGCVLADDMGLGKTVQAIAVILRLVEDGLLPEGALVVAPASLLVNWERELARFAPGLAVTRYHGVGRSLEREARVFLTSYQTAVRDAEKIAERNFSLLVVDEAHLLKNSATRQSRTMKSLRSRFRLALSGTPVENRLEDLRSIFDLVLPGYLGSAADFKRRFRVPIELDRDAAAAARLRAVTAPFLLRRLKTDKTVIADLPDKIVIDEYATLGKAQAALYETVVQKTMAAAERSDDPFQRQALVLNLLTSLKQICDHPRIYDKESPADPELSGKTRLLLDLLEEILEGKEKVLVFSQYVEVLKLLQEMIAAELGERALVFHGGLSQGRRSEITDRFQTDPTARVLLVSLKAGGLGLNLTAASRVVHFDLWYNPAVESQATDRVFRIGQTRNVFVHRLITASSFEEKIDAMLKSKRELAELGVSSGEAWIADLSDEELRELFERG